MKNLTLALFTTIALTGCGGAMATNGSSGNSSGSASEPAAGVFIINNQSSTQICYAMISAHSDPNWGGDQLGANTIPAGESYAWSAGAGVWDVRLQNCDHTTVYENTDGIDIQGAGTILTVTD